MMSRLIDFESLRFGEPLYLWLLVAPALLFVLWCWQLARRRADARKYRALRLVPVRERFAVVGELAFWLGLIAALSLTILALSRPQGVTAMLSPGAFGHGGAYGTQAWIDPGTKRVYILMVQRANFPNSDASEVRRAFQEAASAAFSDTKSK